MGLKHYPVIWLRVSKEWVTWLTYIHRSSMVGMVFQLKNLQYVWAREFPDHKKMFGWQFIHRSPYKELTWSIYVYIVYGSCQQSTDPNTMEAYTYIVSLSKHCVCMYNIYFVKLSKHLNRISMHIVNTYIDVFKKKLKKT